MELCIYFANLKQLMKADEAVRFVDFQAIPPHLTLVLFEYDVNCYEYTVNMASTKWLQQLQELDINISRLYFGQEFCENLIPAPDELEQAFYFSKQYEWNFTYVTGGYLTEKGNDKVIANLNKLKELQPDAEVVVNDWGILYRVAKDFPNFKIIVGRLLNKQKRLNLFTQPERPMPILMKNIDTDRQTIQNNQILAFADVSVSNPDYLELLRKLRVQGVDFDMTPQGIIRPDDGWKLQLGYYYPWAFVATGRTCPTAGVVDPYRSYVMTDRNCGRPCQKFNCSPQLINFRQNILQRGPVLFVAAEKFQDQYFQGTPNYERIIYEPVLPI